MKLLLDAGNTRTKWAVADSNSDQLLDRGVLDRGANVSGLAQLSHFEIDSAWVSCVVSQQVLADLRQGVKDCFSLSLNEAVVEQEAVGMANNYADLTRLGVDRWVAALGARSIYSQGPLIVVDAGTAVTIDLVSTENRFEGGVILPGFVTMHDALLGRTAGIDSEFRQVSSVIGRSTSECVNAGAQFGLIGAVEKVISEMRASEMLSSDDELRILLMGGDAEAIVAGTSMKVELQSDMIFKGLMLLSNR